MLQRLNLQLISSTSILDTAVVGQSDHCYLGDSSDDRMAKINKCQWRLRGTHDVTVLYCSLCSEADLVSQEN